MSFHYDRYDRRQPARARSTLGYWVPLVLSVTVATAGLAAWVWSERRDDEGDASDDESLSYGEERHSRDTARGNENNTAAADNVLGRVQGVIRRTPSPQQVFDSVSKKTAAGWAAAGAALASIREDDRDDAYGDHSRWSEEAAIRRSVEAQSSQSAAVADDHARAANNHTRAADDSARAFAASTRSNPAKRKTVVIVVSAESLMDAHDEDASYRSENATLLSHLPDTDPASTRLFVLVYSPALRSQPPSRSHSRTPSRTHSRSPLGSSYSAIDTPARTPADELASIDPRPDQVYTPALSARSSDTLLWNTLHAQALRLVESPAMIMPFTTPSGFVHMLRHLAPDLVYLVDALSGPDGKNVNDLTRWVAQTVVVVGADGTGLGGLVDTDDETQGKDRASEHHVSKWWESADMVGLGKGVDVVDASRFEDDYQRRVAGRE